MSRLQAFQESLEVKYKSLVLVNAKTIRASAQDSPTSTPSMQEKMVILIPRLCLSLGVKISNNIIAFIKWKAAKNTIYSVLCSSLKCFWGCWLLRGHLQRQMYFEFIIFSSCMPWNAFNAIHQGNEPYFASSSLSSLQPWRLAFHVFHGGGEVRRCYSSRLQQYITV